MTIGRRHDVMRGKVGERGDCGASVSATDCVSPSCARRGGKKKGENPRTSDASETTQKHKAPSYSIRSTPPSPRPTNTTGSSGRIDAGNSPCSTAPGHASRDDAINHTSPSGSRKNKSTT